MCPVVHPRCPGAGSGAALGGTAGLLLARQLRILRSLPPTPSQWNLSQLGRLLRTFWQRKKNRILRQNSSVPSLQREWRAEKGFFRHWETAGLCHTRIRVARRSGKSYWEVIAHSSILNCTTELCQCASGEPCAHRCFLHVSKSTPLPKIDLTGYGHLVKFPSQTWTCTHSSWKTRAFLMYQGKAGTSWFRTRMG